VNTILLIEDNVKLLNVNKEFFESEGYAVHTAETLAEGKAKLQKNPVDLIVLDIMLPDGSGIDFCAEIRKQYDIPILYLTCLSEDTALVDALRAGGDEYMTKPYSLDALLARVAALLRRVRISSLAPAVFTVGSLTVDPQKRAMYLDGADMLLKPKEFDLLLVFARAMGQRFTAEELYALVWSGKALDKQTVTVHISMLRKKLDDSPFYILTERGTYSLHME